MIRLDAQLHGSTMQSLLASIESAEKAARDRINLPARLDRIAERRSAK